jgi:protein-glutamine gamma-glutamyltransferase
MRQTHDLTLTPRLQLQLYLLTGLVLMPHVRHLPIAVSLFLSFTLGWRLACLRWPRLQPGRMLLLLFTATGVALIYSQHQTLLGRDAGVSLLSIMLVLKTLEVRRRRDLYVTVFIAYFVIVTQFLFDQSFPLLVYLLAILIGHTALLMEINRDTPSRHLYQPYRQTLWITLQALPIALILFVIFPRIGQPLWHFGYDQSAHTGLSERIKFGSISQLIQSSEVAFRVSFKQQPPPPETRYWRGLVLWDTDGISWFTATSEPLPASVPKLIGSANPVAYSVFLEPHGKHWLYALDLPAAAPPGTKLSIGFLLSSQDEVNRPFQYEGLSYTTYRTGELSASLRQRALRLGDNITERQKRLVANWRDTSPTDAQLVQRALRFFNENEFVYTLNPPVYKDNPIDQFLFDGREGFCEHYAAAFTQLMRLAGIPARIVIGYQGGEYNHLGDYYTVRQYDAHAWSEVWLGTTGWVRVDPTAAVAPERVRNAIQSKPGSVGEPALFRFDRGGLIGSGLQQLSMLLDASSLQWRRWVLDFSREEQFGLMRSLGINYLHAGMRSLLALAPIALVLGLIALRLLLKGRVKRDPVAVSYRTFCARLSAIGFARSDFEGPLDYRSRVISKRPDLADEVSAITELYIRLRYGGEDAPEQRKALAASVRRFHPARSVGRNSV